MPTSPALAAAFLLTAHPLLPTSLSASPERQLCCQWFSSCCCLFTALAAVGPTVLSGPLLGGRQAHCCASEPLVTWFLSLHHSFSPRMLHWWLQIGVGGQECLQVKHRPSLPPTSRCAALESSCICGNSFFFSFLF